MNRIVCVPKAKDAPRIGEFLVERGFEQHDIDAISAMQLISFLQRNTNAAGEVRQKLLIRPPTLRPPTPDAVILFARYMSRLYPYLACSMKNCTLKK